MIKIQKQNCPMVLQKNSDKWTKDFTEDKKKGITPRARYQHPEIKTAVKEDSFDKCIYCESKISHVYHGDVEHIKPKVLYPELVYDWSNLGYVCAKCNGFKSGQYDENCPFINPYQEDPAKFLFALGPMIFSIKANDRGQLTEKSVRLNRAELIEVRKEKIESIKNLANIYLNTSTPLLKQEILKELKREVSKEKDYSMSSSQFLKAYLSK